MHYETIEDQPRKGYNDSGLTNSLPFHPPQSNSKGRGKGKLNENGLSVSGSPLQEETAKHLV